MPRPDASISKSMQAGEWSLQYCAQRALRAAFLGLPGIRRSRTPRVVTGGRRDTSPRPAFSWRVVSCCSSGMKKPGAGPGLCGEEAWKLACLWWGPATGPTPVLWASHPLPRKSPPCSRCPDLSARNLGGLGLCSRCVVIFQAPIQPTPIGAAEFMRCAPLPRSRPGAPVLPAPPSCAVRSSRTASSTRFPRRPAPSLPGWPGRTPCLA